MTKLLNNKWEKDRKVFLESFPGRKCFQTFDDMDGRKSKKLVYQKSVDGDQYPIDGDIDPSIKIIPVEPILDLEARNGYHAGVFLTINENKGDRRRATDIVKVRAVFADLDGAPIEPVWKYTPSMVVETSPGKYHAYWLCALDDEHYSVPLKAFNPLQKSIIKMFNSDDKVHDLPRVMRIPGFFHHKGEPFLSKIIHYTGIRFEFGLLVEMFPPVPVPKWSAPKYIKKDSLDQDADYKGSYGAGEGGRNNHVIARIGGMLKKGKDWGHIEEEAYKEGSCCSPPLSPAEIKDILKSARRYA